MKSVFVMSCLQTMQMNFSSVPLFSSTESLQFWFAFRTSRHSPRVFFVPHSGLLSIKSKNAQLTMVSVGAELINEADHHSDNERRPEDGVPQLHGEGREEGPGVETLLTRTQQDPHLQIAVGFGEGNHLLSGRADCEGAYRHISRLEIGNEWKK